MQLDNLNGHSYSKSLAITSLLCLVFPAAVLLLINGYWINLPQMDSWYQTVPFIQKYFAQGLGFYDFWMPRYGHRYVLVFLSYFIDYLFFSGSRLPILLMQVFNQAVLLLVFAVQLKKLFPLSSKTYRILIVSFSALLFAPHMRDIWLWGYTLEDTFLALFFCASLFSLRYEFKGVHELILPVAFGVLAGLSSANGLLVWPTLAVMLMVGKAPWRYFFGLSFIGAIFIAVYSYGGLGHSGHLILNPNQTILHRIYYFFAFLGSLFSAGADFFAALFGLIAFGFYVFYSSLLFSRKLSLVQRRKLIPWLALGGLAIASALVGSFARMAGSVGEAMTSRYLPLSALFWCGLIVVSVYFYQHLYIKKRLSLKIGMVLLVSLLSVYYTLSIHSGLKKTRSAYLRESQVVFALQHGVYIIDSREIFRVVPNYLSELQFLKQHHFALFAENPPNIEIGKTIKDYNLTVSAVRAPGEFVKINTKVPKLHATALPLHRGLAISGTMSQRHAGSGEILILDNKGVIYGLARKGGGSGKPLEKWTGFVSLGLVSGMCKPVELQAYLKSEHGNQLHRLSGKQFLRCT